MGLLNRIRRKGDKTAAADLAEAGTSDAPLPPAPPTPASVPPPLEEHGDVDEPLVVLPPVRPPLEDDPFDGLMPPPRRTGSTSLPCSPLRPGVAFSLDPPPPVHTPPHRRVASVPDSLQSFAIETGSPSTAYPSTPDRPPPSPGSPRRPSGARLPMYIQLLTHALQRALALQPSQARTTAPRTRDDVTAACISVVVTAIKAAATEGDALEGGRGERARLHADVRAALADVWSTLDVVDAVAIRPLTRCLRRGPTPYAQRHAAVLLQALAQQSLLVYQSTAAPLVDLMAVSDPPLRNAALSTLCSYLDALQTRQARVAEAIDELTLAMQEPWQVSLPPSHHLTEIQSDTHNANCSAGDLAAALARAGAPDVLLGLLRDAQWPMRLRPSACRLLAFVVGTDAREGSGRVVAALTGGASGADALERQNTRLVLRILEEVAGAPHLRASLLLAGAAPLLQALASSGGGFAPDARRILAKLQGGSSSSPASSSGVSVSSGVTVASGEGEGAAGILPHSAPGGGVPPLPS